MAQPAAQSQMRLGRRIGYVAPKDKLEGREEAIFAERDRELEEAREPRRVNRQRARSRDRDKHRVPKPTVEAIGTGGYQLTRTRHFSISRRTRVNRRRTRPMDGLKSEEGMDNFNHLWLAKETPPKDGHDWLWLGLAQSGQVTS